MNSNWSSGYVADLTYSHGYYHELSPGFLRFFLLLHGLANGSEGGPYTYCELGYGQGVSGNLHAAANPRGRFWGTDFNPDHALFAQGLAREAGVDATWLAHGFEQMLDADLPQFDFVTLHGVWSWVDASARHALVEFLRRRLKVGGVVYISYNVMPGWSAEKPLRDLLWWQTELGGAAGDSTASRIRGALDFATRLRRGKAAYFENNSKAGQMLDDMLRDDVHVVAHEYFNRSWHITYFADLARDLEAAGLGFACSIHKSDLVGEVLQRRRSSGMLEMDLNPALRETTNDFLLNRRFRRDLFVRGAARIRRPERQARLMDVGFVLLRQAASLSATVQTPYGSVALDAEVLGRLQQVLGAAKAPMTLRQVIEQGGLAQANFEIVVETLAALVAQSQAFPVFPDDAACHDPARTRAMNQVIASRARHDDTLHYLASPVTGHAVDATHTDRLLLHAWAQGARTATALAEAAWPLQRAYSRCDEAQADAMRQDLSARADVFVESVKPIWHRLGLLEADT